MKVLLYAEGLKTIGKSGLGKAIQHQMKALEDEKIEYTLNSKDDYDILHINTWFLKSYLMARKAKRKGYLSPSLTSMEPTISPSGEIPFSTSQFGKKYRSPVQSTNHHKNRSFEICARDDSCKRSIVYRSTGAKTRFFCSEQQDRNPDNEPADAGRMADAIRYFPQECRS